VTLERSTASNNDVATMPQPQFIFVELPSFRIRDKNSNSVNLNHRQLGHVISRLQYVRSSLQASYSYANLCVSILFSGGETDLWTSSYTEGGLHSEENLLLTYFQSFDSPGAYPIVDAMLLAVKPCSDCMDYFSLSGKHLRPQDRSSGLPATIRAKFTPRSDKSYTPVFYLSRSLSPEDRSNLWLQLGQMWSTGTSLGMGGSFGTAALGLAQGQAYYLYGDGTGSPWYAISGQENMTDAEIAEAITRAQMNPVFWIGR